MITRSLLAFALVLAGCTPQRDELRAHVQEVCGVPAKDLGNVDSYATCVYTVLDIEAEAKNSSPPMGGAE